MNRIKRLLFHAILWLAFWVVSFLLGAENEGFIQKNAPVFLMQIAVVAVLIYYTAPALLFKKKYLLFAGVSLVVLVLCSFFISNNITGPIDGPPPLLNGAPPESANASLQGRPPIGIGPPQYLIHFLALAIAYVLATFMETFLYAKKKEEETIRTKNENLQTELKLLKSQINPHFLFNALNNIYALSAIDSEKTQQSISSLSEMLRYVLYECEQEWVPLEKEITYIKNYLKLFSLKSSKLYPIEAELDVENPKIEIAPMLLIPFVENALKHGNIEKISDAFIRLKIITNQNKIQFEIENSVSKSPAVVDEVGGIGMENVRKRLKIIYPNQHELLINETSRAFKVNLNIDMNGND